MRILLALLSLWGLGTAMAAAPISEYTLSNGLRLIVKEDHRSPVVVSEIWYRVGSSLEPRGLTGISHMLEHMMFEGTPTYPDNRFSETVAQNGGQQNAETSLDYTLYYQQISADKLPLVFELEADRMKNLLLTPAKYAKESEVVKEERRLRIDNNPQMKLYEQFAAHALLGSPYQNPTIGWMSDLNQMTLKDLSHWYHTWYAPNNAIVVVVGDVNPAEVLALAKKYFGDLAPSKIPAIKSEAIIKPLGENEMRAQLPANVPWLIMGYKVPSIKSASEAYEPYALQMLGGILDAGQSSRLDRILIRKQEIANSINVSYALLSRFDTLFLIDASPAKGKTLTQLKSAILEQITELQKKPVSEKELDIVKNQVIASRVYAQDSTMQQAEFIGSLAVVDLPIELDSQLIEKLNAVTPEQIQAVAKKYLTVDALTVAELTPKAEKRGS